MEQYYQARGGNECEPKRADPTAGQRLLTILQRYSAGEISSWQAAKGLGAGATERDVFARISAAHLPLPFPSLEEIVLGVAALRSVYVPHGSKFC